MQKKKNKVSLKIAYIIIFMFIVFYTNSIISLVGLLLGIRTVLCIIVKFGLNMLIWCIMCRVIRSV